MNELIISLISPLECVVEVDHIESVNNMYDPRFIWKKNPHGGKAIRQFSGMMLSPGASRMKATIMKSLNDLKFELNKNNLNMDYPFVITVVFVLNKNIMKRDLDNMIKITLDAIFNKLKLNDSRIFEFRSKKLLLKGSKFEYIKIRLELSELPLSEWVVK